VKRTPLCIATFDLAADSSEINRLSSIMVAAAGIVCVHWDLYTVLYVGTWYHRSIPWVSIEYQVLLCVD